MENLKLILIVLLFWGPGQSVRAQLNQPFPATELTDLNEKQVNTAELAASGKVTLVSFWAIWCAPCRTELNALRDAFPDWKRKYDAAIVAISIDDERSNERIQKMNAEQKWNFVLWRDPDQKLKNKLGFPTVPYMVILDKKGNIRYIHTAFLDGDDNIIEEELAKLNKE